MFNIVYTYILRSTYNVHVRTHARTHVTHALEQSHDEYRTKMAQTSDCHEIFNLTVIRLDKLFYTFYFLHVFH